MNFEEEVRNEYERTYEETYYNAYNDRENCQISFASLVVSDNSVALCVASYGEKDGKQWRIEQLAYFKENNFNALILKYAETIKLIHKYQSIICYYMVSDIIKDRFENLITSWNDEFTNLPVEVAAAVKYLRKIEHEEYFPKTFGRLNMKQIVEAAIFGFQSDLISVVVRPNTFINPPRTIQQIVKYIVDKTPSEITWAPAIAFGTVVGTLATDAQNNNSDLQLHAGFL